MLELLRKMQNICRELYSVPQRSVHKAEIALYFVLPAAFAVAGAIPTAGLVVMPIILPILYLLYRRFGVYFPLCCILLYGLLSLVFNYDILTVVYFVALFFGFIGLVFSCQISPYLACAAAAAVFAIIGAFIGVGIVRLAENKPIGEIASEYVLNRDDGIIRFFAHDYYDAMTPAPNEDKLSRGDDGYNAAATLAFSDYAKDEFTYYIWYYCIHYGAVCAAVGFFVASFVNGRTASAFDSIACHGVQHLIYSQAEKEELNKSTRALGGVRKPITAIAGMRMPRAYLWSCLLPATITAFVLWFVGGYDFISSTVMHLFATLPSAFSCFALLVYFAGLFKGRAKFAANVIAVLLGIAAVMFPIVLFALSILGICDCIIDIRYWVEYIKRI